MSTVESILKNSPSNLTKKVKINKRHQDFQLVIDAV